MHATINKDRLSEASSIITKYSAFAFGGGVIPFPMMDIAAVSGIQIKMLAEIARLYEVEFVDNWGKSTLTALIGGAVPHWLAVGTVGSLIKAIPVLGSAIGFATMPLLSAATTYAVGKVFVQHFESGGTFLDFDVQMAKDVFKEHFAKGKQVFMEQAANFKLRRNCDATEAETPAAQPVDVEVTPVTPAPAEESKPADVAPRATVTPQVGEDETTAMEAPVRRRRTRSNAPATSL